MDSLLFPLNWPLVGLAGRINQVTHSRPADAKSLMLSEARKVNLHFSTILDAKVKHLGVHWVHRKWHFCTWTYCACRKSCFCTKFSPPDIPPKVGNGQPGPGSLNNHGLRNVLRKYFETSKCSDDQLKLSTSTARYNLDFFTPHPVPCWTRFW